MKKNKDKSKDTKDYNAILQEATKELYGTDDSVISVIAEKELALLSAAGENAEAIERAISLPLSELVELSKGREKSRMQGIINNNMNKNNQSK